MKRKLLSLFLQSILFLGLGLAFYWFFFASQL